MSRAMLHPQPGERWGDLVVIRTDLRAPRSASERARGVKGARAVGVICCSTWEYKGRTYTCGHLFRVNIANLPETHRCLSCAARIRAAERWHPDQEPAA